jgi:oligopeptide transport system ATP-binding protein
MKLLQVRNLRTSFFVREGEVKAVDHVFFDLEREQTLGIVGESGCGKSMTGLSIMGLVPHPGRIKSGEIILENNNLLTMYSQEMQKIRGRKIAMIFQDPMTSLNPSLTIARQITEAMEEHLGMDHREAIDAGIDLLQRVGIVSPQNRIKDYPHQFSGGMRQRVMIAMALSCNPKILIADEPTTALDVTIQAQILELIQKICGDLGTAVILISHDLGVVARISNRVAVMYAGQFIELAETEELFKYPLHPYTLGLLASIPRIDQKKDRKLLPIEGLPPSLLNPPHRCLFAPRCRFSIELCWKKQPALEEKEKNHLASCWRSHELNKLRKSEGL